MLQMLLFNLFCRREIEVEVVGFYSVAHLISFIAEMSADRKYFSVDFYSYFEHISFQKKEK